MKAIFSGAMRASKATVFTACLAVMLGLLAAKPAHAKTFTVNSTEDFTDIAPGDGTCDAVSSPLLNPCTLRAAIQEANAFSGADTIAFDISGSGVKTISPDSQLPEITRRVTIDGYTQPNASPNTNLQGAINASPLIELDGTNAGANGLLIGGNASNTVIRGLVINRFDNGIASNDPGIEGIKVVGNIIGTDASDTGGLGNTDGVDFQNNNNNVVGGTTPAARNIISGNIDDGVVLSSSGNRILGNLIGTQKNGTSSLGNGGDGVLIGHSNNTVGGTASGAANVIAFNGSDGVSVVNDQNTGNRILSNSIHSNAGLGIDLGNDGVTSNELKDPDTGPNNLQNYPVLTSITASGGQTAITGYLNSRPGKTYTIQFFSSFLNDPSSHGEGKTLLGKKKVETNKKGKALFSFTTTLPAGETYVTATATGGGGTSEFSHGEYAP